jgi:hypothetical protein
MLRIPQVLFVLFGYCSVADAAPFIGNWNLSAWSNSVLAGTVNNPAISSDGVRPVGLQSSLTSSASFSYFGQPNGSLLVQHSPLVAAFGVFVLTQTSTFTLDRAIDFGPGQHQFSGSGDNGIGVSFSTSGSTDFMIMHSVQIRMIGGGVFSSAAMSGAGYSAPAGVGTNTLTTSVNASASTSATLHGLVVSGPVTKIEVTQSASGVNTNAVSFPASVSVTFKINSTETAQPPALMLSGKIRRTTTRSRLVLRGTATDANNDLSRVEFKAGSGPSRIATGLASWQARVKLKPGTNRVQLHAVDRTDATSDIVRVKVRRR